MGGVISSLVSSGVGVSSMIFRSRSERREGSMLSLGLVG
jgi:hypothetical protein